ADRFLPPCCTVGVISPFRAVLGGRHPNHSETTGGAMQGQRGRGRQVDSSRLVFAPLWARLLQHAAVAAPLIGRRQLLPPLPSPPPPRSICATGASTFSMFLSTTFRSSARCCRR